MNYEHSICLKWFDDEKKYYCINRKKNIEEGGNQNAPSNTPTEERPRQMRTVGNDTITR